MPQASHRAQVTFHGTVQGVGFRYTACRIASRHPHITGAVRNEPNGSVALTAEGTRQQLEAFLSEIISSMSGYITTHNVQWSTGTPSYHAFGIER